MTGGPATIRLDKWLWHARLCRSRSLAADMVAGGAVRLNTRRVRKPATPVRVGDGLVFVQAGRVRALRVRALGTRRGPATEAQTLYLDLDAPSGNPAGPLDPAGRVDKYRSSEV